jgi:O-methyltransferase
LQLPKFLKTITPRPVYDACRSIYIGFVNFEQRRAITPLPKNHEKIFTFFERLQFFKAASVFLKSNEVRGCYLEFGCYQVNTFRMALNTLARNELIPHFYAFDSFQGLPEASSIDKQAHWTKVPMTTTEAEFREICQKDLHQITTVPGFYDQSLPDFSLHPGHEVAFAYVDCDYYSSTRSVLEFLEPHLRHGMILAFDDWDCFYGDNERGQRKAFLEFRDRTNERFRFEPFHRIRTGGNSFIVQDRKLIGTDFG